MEEGFTPVIRAIRKWDPEVRRELRRELRAGGTMIVTGARTLAAAHSKQTPPTVKLRTGIQSRQAEIRIDAGSADVPIAGLLELGNKRGGSKARRFRHPVHGHRDRWVNQDMHPYLAPIVKLRLAAVTKRIGAAVDRANTKVGL